MSVQALKEQLIEKIQQTDDEDLLMEMAELLEPMEGTLYKFSDEEWAHVKKGLADAENGRMLDATDVKTYLEECAGLTKSQIRPPFS